MTLRPLIASELRLAVRRPSTPRLRMGCAMAAMALAMGHLLVWSAWRPVAKIGELFFQSLAGVGYVGALVSGLLLAADSVSREKREGTLGLLFLTDLRPRDVILGKLIGKAILPLYGLLAMVPTLAVAVLVGGITAGEFARMFLAWSNALILALAASLWTSTFWVQQRPAHLTASFVVLFLAAAIPYLASIPPLATLRPWCFWLATLGTPTGPYRLAFARSYQSSGGFFWTALAANQLLAVVLLILATVRVLKFGGEVPVRQKAFSRPGRGIFPFRSVPLEREREALWSQPIAWLERHKAGHPLLLWGVPILAVLVFWPVASMPARSGHGRFGLVLFFFAQVGLRLWAAAYGAYAFALDRRTGALESLLGTRVDVPEIAAGMFRGFAWKFAGSLAAAGGIGILLALTLVRDGSLGWAGAVILLSLLTLWDCYALFWIGLFQGLAARTPAIAFLGTLFRVLLLPWFWMAVVAQLFSANARPFLTTPATELFAIWFVVVLVNNGAFLIDARGKLRRYFRVLALKPFGEKKPHIESDWSPINWEEPSSESETSESGSLSGRTSMAEQPSNVARSPSS